MPINHIIIGIYLIFKIKTKPLKEGQKQMQNKMSEIKKNAPLDIFNEDLDNVVLTTEKASSGSNLYKPDLKKAIDPKVGYLATLRFLPEMSTGKPLYIVDKEVIYVNLPSYQNLSGSYDSLKNFGQKCPLNQLQWQLKKSTNVVDQEMAKNLTWYKKYYSLVQIVEDKNQPELTGKIMIFSYGTKIKEKMEQELNGTITGTKCNVFSLVKGKDFRICLKTIGGFNNYDQSTFLAESPIKIFDNGKFIKTPIDADGKVAPNVQAKIMDYISKKDVVLTDFNPQPWTTEQTDNVNKIVELLVGRKVPVSTPPTKVSQSDSQTDEDLDEFFGKVEE